VGLFEILAVLTVLTAGFGWINQRYLGLPTTIGLVLMALLVSLGVVLVHPFYPRFEEDAARLLAAIDFDRVLLHGLLGFLLFTGALHVDLGDLREHALVIGVLATVSVVVSTALVGSMSWLVLHWLGLPVPLLHCLMFGALISPTDPIAVLSMLKSLGAPRTLETQIAGESLFNDGVGVVVFLALLESVAADVAPAGVLALFVREALGGAVFGLGAGLVAYWMLKRIDDYQVEILISLALVTGGYLVADRLHLSAPIAMVVAGLIVGNHGRAFAMSERTREHLDAFWELVDEILNAVLFVLIGLEVLVLTVRREYVLAGVAAIPVVLLARFLATGMPIRLLAHWIALAPHTVKILTWSGLRGGISVALALSLREHLPSATADALIVMTYVVVVFSIVVQGLTIKPLFRRYLPAESIIAAAREQPR